MVFEPVRPTVLDPIRPTVLEPDFVLLVERASTSMASSRSTSRDGSLTSDGGIPAKKGNTAGVSPRSARDKYATSFEPPECGTLVEMSPAAERARKASNMLGDFLLRRISV